MTLPADVRDYPDAIAQALSQLRLVGVNGPYSVLLGADAYTALSETSDHGYPVLEHVKRPGQRRDHLGAGHRRRLRADHARRRFRPASSARTSRSAISSHTDNAVRLYLQETFTFLLLTTEAAVALTAGDGKPKP